MWRHRGQSWRVEQMEWSTTDTFERASTRILIACYRAYEELLLLTRGSSRLVSKVEIDVGFLEDVATSVGPWGSLSTYVLFLPAPTTPPSDPTHQG